MPINVKTFRDIDLDFGRHPVTGDVLSVSNDVAVKRSIRNLISYNLYEKPFDPTFGSNLRGALGEIASLFTDSLLRDKIVDLIAQEEPRALVESVDISDADGGDNNGLNVTVSFTVVNIPDILTVSVYLDKLR